jgi:hypothetical protein
MRIDVDQGMRACGFHRIRSVICVASSVGKSQQGLEYRGSIDSNTQEGYTEALTQVADVELPLGQHAQHEQDEGHHTAGATS